MRGQGSSRPGRALAAAAVLMLVLADLLQAVAAQAQTTGYALTATIHVGNQPNQVGVNPVTNIIVLT
jgi:hypothetical protein